MIAAVALGPDGAVFSVFRDKKASHVVAHTRERAVSLYSTADKLEALWVSPTGALHAAGKQHHTNVGGAWRTHKLPTPAMSIGGASDDAVFVGGAEGVVARWTDGGWEEIADLGESVTGIYAPSASSVWFVGYFDDLRYFDGRAIVTREGPGGLQGIYGDKETLWLCGTSELYVLEGAAATVVANVVGKSELEEIYGVGVGAGGVFLHGGVELLRVDDDKVEVVVDNSEKALMVKRATYPTCITSNGARVVAGGACSVLVEDGDGFQQWPALEDLDAPKPAAKAAKKSAKKS